MADGYMSNADVEALFQSILTEFVPDTDREGLRDTPARMRKAWSFWTSGYDKNPADVLKTFADGAEGYDALVFQGGIRLCSRCEHHGEPFFGVAHIGYIPNGRVVGLSKLSRVADIFARRLQVQERLTCQIADTLLEHLNPLAVGVTLQMRHMCMESRGVCKHGTVTTTTALRGAFRNEPDARAEFMSLVLAASREHSVL